MEQLWLNAVIDMDMDAKVRNNCGLDFVRFDVMRPIFPAVRPDSCIHKRC